MIEMNVTPQLVEITASGKLTKADYDRFVPELERLATERGALRLLIILEDFDGWEPAALWEDVKYDVTHQDDMDRIAVVGDGAVQEWVTRLARPFFKAETRFFPHVESTAAREWIVGD